jgi:hypothetical protein
MRRFVVAITLLSAPLFADGSHEEELVKAAPTLTEEEGRFQPFTGKVKGARVRMRTQPDLEGHIVRELNKDDLLVVVGEAHDYFAVQPPKDMKAYVYRTYVLDGEVQGSHVNVRLSPDVEAPIIGQLNTGDKIEGRVVESNNRWLEVEPPAGACFFIAKDFLHQAGGPEMIATHDRRLKEVGHLLNSAYLTSQAELRKPFQEIDMEKVRSNFERVVADYSEFEEFAAKAEKVLNLAQELYLQKKIAFLESHADDSALAWDARSAALTADLEEYQRRLKGFEEELQSDILAVATSAVEVIESSELSFELDEADILMAAVPELGLSEPKLLQPAADITDKMALWLPVEESLYHLWAMDNGERSMREFYANQQVEAEMLEGIVEAYGRPVQNRPGDFMLRVNNRPVAFLYSTQVNLEDLVGEKVKVRAVKRPSNNFAFPAYYVMDIG